MVATIKVPTLVFAWILIIGICWRWVFIFTLRPFYSLIKSVLFLSRERLCWLLVAVWAFRGTETSVALGWKGAPPRPSCGVYCASLSGVIQVRSVGSLYIWTRRKTGWTVAEVWGMWMTDKLLQEFLDPLSIESQLELCHLYLLWHWVTFVICLESVFVLKRHTSRSGQSRIWCNFLLYRPVSLRVLPS